MILDVRFPKGLITGRSQPTRQSSETFVAEKSNRAATVRERNPGMLIKAFITAPLARNLAGKGVTNTTVSVSR